MIRPSSRPSPQLSRCSPKRRRSIATQRINLCPPSVDFCCLAGHWLSARRITRGPRRAHLPPMRHPWRGTPVAISPVEVAVWKGGPAVTTPAQVAVQVRLLLNTILLLELWIIEGWAHSSAISRHCSGTGDARVLVSRKAPCNGTVVSRRQSNGRQTLIQRLCQQVWWAREGFCPGAWAGIQGLPSTGRCLGSRTAEQALASRRQGCATGRSSQTIHQTSTGSASRLHALIQ